MLKINIQLFAHKKGMGSTKNGRDSESKRLGAKRADGQTEAVTELSIHFSLRFQSACFTRGCECFYMLP